MSTQQQMLDPPPSPDPPFITEKSHRLRTSPVPGEGSTYVPVVKFTQSFTQRNALRATQPVYGSTPSLHEPPDADIVSLSNHQRLRDPSEARARGWTISITSSTHTDEELQVEVQHFEPHVPSNNDVPTTEHRSKGGSLGGIEPVIPRPLVQPRISPPLRAQIPTLAHDRVLITEDDLSRLRIKCLSLLFLGLLFPPLWLLIGWSHILDPIILPATGRTASQHYILATYKPYRTVAAVLAGIVVLGTFVGIIIGALALAGVIG